ncbi:MAG TPA: hypothetical protein VHO47_04035 [Candidatus Babeliales bacterium]|nr:hypothetical protein [Candidatus Babeliales bacterium]
MKLFSKLIIGATIMSPLFCNDYFNRIPKLDLKQTGLIKMSIGSLLMLYGSAQFGIPVPLFSENRFASFSTLFNGALFTGTGFTLFESGLSNYRQEKNVALEPRSIIKHWDDHIMKAAKYSVLIAAVPIARYLAR